MGALFADKREDLLALTLWKRILSVIEGLLEALSHLLPVTPEQMLAACMADDSIAKQYRIMLQALCKIRSIPTHFPFFRWHHKILTIAI
jgi:hypothetical protein